MRPVWGGAAGSGGERFVMGGLEGFAGRLEVWRMLRVC